MRPFFVGCILSLLPLRSDAFSPNIIAKSPRTKLCLISVQEEQQDGSAAVKFVDDETKCEVVLLGCLHGSSSSAEDVRQSLSKPKKTDVVVLELCEARFSDLQKDFEKNTDNNSESHKKGGPFRFFSFIAKRIKTRGLADGIATFILGAISSLQTALSDFEPGLEFMTALEVSSTIDDCEIILADQAVDDTLKRLGELPSESIGMMREFVNNKFNWDETYGRESSALGTAIFGNKEALPHQMNLGHFLTRNEAAQKDVARLALPPILIYQCLIIGSYSILDMVEGNDDSTYLAFLKTPLSLVMDLSVSPLAVVSSFSIELVSSLFFLFLGYVIIALPATRLILCERDDQLAKGIRTACNVATSKIVASPEEKGNIDSSSKGRVVAVLGFLHVNGVAKHLLSQKQKIDV